MINDSLVVVLVLGLLFLAVSYYLYSRIGLLERKVSLMENILLDLKVTTEQALLSATEPQGYKSSSSNADENDAEQEDEHDMSDSNEESRNLVVNSTPKTVKQAITVEHAVSSNNKSTANYESMTYKELIQLAKTKGISGTRNLSKSQVIDMIRRHVPDESGTTVSFDNDTSEGTNLNELLSAQSAEGAKLEDTDVDSSLVQ